MALGVALALLRRCSPKPFDKAPLCRKEGVCSAYLGFAFRISFSFGFRLWSYHGLFFMLQDRATDRWAACHHSLL